MSKGIISKADALELAAALRAQIDESIHVAFKQIVPKLQILAEELELHSTLTAEELAKLKTEIAELRAQVSQKSAAPVLRLAADSKTSRRH